MKGEREREREREDHSTCGTRPAWNSVSDHLQTSIKALSFSSRRRSLIPVNLFLKYLAVRDRKALPLTVTFSRPFGHLRRAHTKQRSHLHRPCSKHRNDELIFPHR